MQYGRCSDDAENTPEWRILWGRYNIKIYVHADIGRVWGAAHVPFIRWPVAVSYFHIIITRSSAARKTLSRISTLLFM